MCFGCIGMTEGWKYSLMQTKAAGLIPYNGGGTRTFFNTNLKYKHIIYYHVPTPSDIFPTHPLCSQPRQLLQELHLWHLSFHDSSSPSLGMSHYWAWVEQLIPILSTSLAQVHCVLALIVTAMVSTHSRACLHAATHAQYRQHRRGVTHLPSKWQELAVVGGWEDLRVNLCAYKVHGVWSLVAI